uniref:protein-histidine N-methyltransferase n=1 Tax=Peronospora matthiolae TaxID=2874970 RepID=A0AAV1UB55_9STRA
MSFSFNFALDASTCATSSSPSVTPSTVSVRQRDGERFTSKLCAPPPVFSAVQVGDVTFEMVQTTSADFVARTGAIGSFLTTTDVQTGVYEGGFKLWECALDLVKLLATQRRQGATMAASVLELGCGHGLPGIYALQQGAELVTFSDYNKEVLELTTCPNVRRNVDEQMFERAEFYAGAWSGMSQYMETVELKTQDQMQFDLILTAETIYTEAVAVELYQTIKRHLRRAPNARALVAAKKYYFGTNGSIQHFVGLVRADGVFTADTVWQERDGRSNIREIVQLTYVDEC